MRYISIFITFSVLAAQTIAGGHRSIFAVITGTPPVFSHSCQAEQISGGGFSTVACDVAGGTGDTIMAVSRNSTASSTLSSYSMTGCTAGGAWAIDDTANMASGSTAATQQGHAYNITSGGTCHIIATFSSTTGVKTIWVHAITGARTAGDPLNQHGIDALTTTSAICGDCLASSSKNTTENNQYIFGACIDSNILNLANGTGFTLREGDTARGLTEDLLKVALGTIAVTCGRTSTTGSMINVHIMTFRSATPL